MHGGTFWSSLLPLAGLHGLRTRKTAEEVRLAYVTKRVSGTTHRNLRLRMRRRPQDIEGGWERIELVGGTSFEG
jgi:hypothetical protein